MELLARRVVAQNLQTAMTQTVAMVVALIVPCMRRKS